MPNLTTDQLAAILYPDVHHDRIDTFDAVVLRMDADGYKRCASALRMAVAGASYAEIGKAFSVKKAQGRMIYLKAVRVFRRTWEFTVADTDA